jgi:N-methylhydantoinase A
MGVQIGVDTGGTFTDIVALDELTGRIITTKTPTTPANPAEGFMRGIRKIAQQAGFRLSDIDGVSHGTTIATNALLAETGSLPGLGLIVTKGFKNILEIARQTTGGQDARGFASSGGYGNS